MGGGLMEERGGKFLLFSLKNETYGIPIKTVKEIIGMQEVTWIPKNKEYNKGVINLRGKIVPIIDLRLKFGMEEKTYTDRTCIIVIEIDLNSNQRLIGLVVDSVAEVHNILKTELEEPGENAQIEGDLLMGIGKLNDKVVLLINIEKILTEEDAVLLKSPGEMNGESSIDGENIDSINLNN